MSQCGGGQDGGLHHSQYSFGADALRRCGRHLPDSQNAANTTAGNGADGGTVLAHRNHCHVNCSSVTLSLSSVFLSVLRTNITSAIRPLLSTLEVLITMQHRRRTPILQQHLLWTNGEELKRRKHTMTTTDANYYLSVQILILMLWLAF